MADRDDPLPPFQWLHARDDIECVAVTAIRHDVVLLTPVGSLIVGRQVCGLHFGDPDGFTELRISMTVRRPVPALMAVTMLLAQAW